MMQMDPANRTRMLGAPDWEETRSRSTHDRTTTLSQCMKAAKMRSLNGGRNDIKRDDRSMNSWKEF